jgi:hypothetical protein
MKPSPRDQWFVLHTHYHIDSKANPSGLMADAHIFLDSAHGLAQTLSDTIEEDRMLNHDRLSSALNGIAILVEMGRRCVAKADLRMMSDNDNQLDRT